MQTSAVRGDDLCVIAPLFYEAAHLIVRDPELFNPTSTLDLTQISGRRIAVGPVGSGSRKTADMILDSLNLPPDQMSREVIAWSELYSSQAPDIALICIGRGSSLVDDLLKNDWRLMAIPQHVEIAMQHPTLLPITINQTHYDASSVIPPEGIATVGTTAFLATRRDAPSALVQSTLELLYQPPRIFVGLIPREHAAEWQNLIYHDTARHYFELLDSNPEED
jgi:TRAP-type uncharacterized transport system substrate-binding protein